VFESGAFAAGVPLVSAGAFWHAVSSRAPRTNTRIIPVIFLIDFIFNTSNKN
jgi:hypothetical protein